MTRQYNHNPRCRYCGAKLKDPYVELSPSLRMLYEGLKRKKKPLTSKEIAYIMGKPKGTNVRGHLTLLRKALLNSPVVRLGQVMLNRSCYYFLNRLQTSRSSAETLYELPIENTGHPISE